LGEAIALTWVKDRLREYAKGKRDLEKYRDSLIGDESDDMTDEVREEVEIVSGMISDMNYAIEWMRSGRRPNSRRGIEIHDAYSRSIMMDMDLLPRTEPEPEMAVSIERKRELVRILLKLSAREQQCYLLHTAHGMSFADISKEIHLSKASVQRYVDRARAKVGQGL
jgi:RNA polymerase sigma-70 factor (ECF subfamily)